MKLFNIAAPGILTLGIAGLAATAMVGFAVGTVVARDPQRSRRAMRRVVREGSRALDHATRLATEAREQFSDIVAQAREEAAAGAAESPQAAARSTRPHARHRKPRRPDAGPPSDPVAPAVGDTVP